MPGSGRRSVLGRRGVPGIGRGHFLHLGLGIDAIHGLVGQEPVTQEEDQPAALIFLLKGLEILAGTQAVLVDLRDHFLLADLQPFLPGDAQEQNKAARGFLGLGQEFLAKLLFRLAERIQALALALEPDGKVRHQGTHIRFKHGLGQGKVHHLQQAVQQLFLRRAPMQALTRLDITVGDGGLELVHILLAHGLGKLVVDGGELALLDGMHLDLHGHGLARQVRGHKIRGEADLPFALPAGTDGLDQRLKILQGFALAQGQVKALGLDARHRFAVFKGLKVDIGDLPVSRGRCAVHRHDLGAVAPDALNDLRHFGIVHAHRFLLDLQPLVGRQVKGRQHLKLHAVGVALAALQRRLGPADGNAGDRLRAELLHHVIDMHVDEVLAGLVINPVMEALFHHRRRNLALAEAVQLDGIPVQGHRAENGGLRLLRLGGDGHLFLDRGNVFNAVFHKWLLLFLACAGNGAKGGT